MISSSYNDPEFILTSEEATFAPHAAFFQPIFVSVIKWSKIIYLFKEIDTPPSEKAWKVYLSFKGALIIALILNLRKITLMKNCPD